MPAAWLPPAAAAANVLRAVKRCVKLAGTTPNRIFSTASGEGSKSIHSIPADDREIFSENLASDSPRHPRHPAVASVWRAEQRPRAVLAIAAADFAVPAADVVVCRAGWRGNSDWPATESTGERDAGMPGYNSVAADALGETSVCNVSANSVEYVARPLVLGDEAYKLSAGSWEEGSRRSSLGAKVALRFEATLHAASSTVIQRDPQCDPGHHRDSRIAFLADHHRQMVQARPRASPSSSIRRSTWSVPNAQQRSSTAVFCITTCR